MTYYNKYIILNVQSLNEIVCMKYVIEFRFTLYSN